MLQTESPVFLKLVSVLLRDKVPLRLQVFLGTTPIIIFDLSQNEKDIVRNCCGLFEGTNCHLLCKTDNHYMQLHTSVQDNISIPNGCGKGCTHVWIIQESQQPFYLSTCPHLNIKNRCNFYLSKTSRFS